MSENFENNGWTESEGGENKETAISQLVLAENQESKPSFENEVRQSARNFFEKVFSYESPVE